MTQLRKLISVMAFFGSLCAVKYLKWKKMLVSSLNYNMMTIILQLINVKRTQKRIITWTSLSFNELAISDLSVRLKYFFAWNSRSNSKSWTLVNAVLLRRDLFSVNWRTSAAVFCLFCGMPLTHFPGNQLLR